MKWLTLACAILIAAIVIAADKGQRPGFITALYAFPAGDKVGYAVLFGTLAFMLNISLLLGPGRSALAQPRLVYPRSGRARRRRGVIAT